MRNLIIAKTAHIKNALWIHLVSGLVCVLIAGCAMYFANQSIQDRRGVFLDARHELRVSRENLNTASAQHREIDHKVRDFEERTKDLLQLIPVSRYNERSAKIVQIAESSGVIVDSLQRESMLEDAPVPVLPMIFYGQAKAQEAFEFIDRFNDHMPDIHLQQVEINLSNDQSDMIYLELEMIWFVDHDGAHAQFSKESSN